jgi:hypothetical protein
MAKRKPLKTIRLDNADYNFEMSGLGGITLTFTDRASRVKVEVVLSDYAMSYYACRFRECVRAREGDIANIRLAVFQAK